MGIGLSCMGFEDIWNELIGEMRGYWRIMGGITVWRGRELSEPLMNADYYDATDKGVD